MGKKKGTRTRKKKRLVRGTTYVSPDGGETVYEQLANGMRGKMISQSQYAKDVEKEIDEAEMVGREAIKLRRKYPTLQKAWDRYKTVWHIVNED